MSTGERPGAGVVWAQVEDGFHVGSCNGNFLGYIDRDERGAYVAFDMRSREIGRFAHLIAAMRELSATTASGTTTDVGSRA